MMVKLQSGTVCVPVNSKWQMGWSGGVALLKLEMGVTRRGSAGGSAGQLMDVEKLGHSCSGEAGAAEGVDHFGGSPGLALHLRLPADAESPRT